MKNKLKGLYYKIEPADLIAIIIIVGVLLLNWKGIQTMYSMSIYLIIGYYFGRKLTRNGH